MYFWLEDFLKNTKDTSSGMAPAYGCSHSVSFLSQKTTLTNHRLEMLEDQSPTQVKTPDGQEVIPTTRTLASNSSKLLPGSEAMEPAII